jgi:hypothetical protein
MKYSVYDSRQMNIIAGLQNICIDNAILQKIVCERALSNLDVEYGTYGKDSIGHEYFIKRTE